MGLTFHQWCKGGANNFDYIDGRWDRDTVLLPGWYPPGYCSFINFSCEAVRPYPDLRFTVVDFLRFTFVFVEAFRFVGIFIINYNLFFCLLYINNKKFLVLILIE